MWNGHLAELRAARGLGLESARRRPRHLARRRRNPLRCLPKPGSMSAKPPTRRSAPISTRRIQRAASPIRGRVIPGGNPFPQNGKAFFPTTGGTYVNMPINPKPTYVAQLERHLSAPDSGDWLASISYLGNKTTHLWSNGGEINPALYIPGNCPAGSTVHRARSLLHHQQHQPAPHSVSGESSRGAAYAQHQHHWMTEPSRTIRAVLVSAQHSFAHNFHVQRQLHRFLLHFRRRLRRRAGR